MASLAEAPHGPAEPPAVLRRGLLLVAVTTLLAGLLAGLARIGVVVGCGATHAADHGPLLVLGAFCTVIGLERAVALGRSWALAAPASGAAGAVGLLAGLEIGAWFASLSAVLLCVLNAAIVRRQPALATGLMLLGSLLLGTGTLAWTLGRPVSEVVTTWMGFFVLTIAAERLELCRLAPTPRRAHRALAGLASLLGFASLAPLFGWPSLVRVGGVLLAAIGAWQLHFDLARRLLSRAGLPRFAAVGVLGGAAWLVVSGGVLAVYGLPAAGPIYDAALHGVFVGYVLSMVFAHAPIVLPAVARIELRFSALSYVPLALLHSGLLLRVTGDLAGAASLRRAGSVASVLALAVFAATLLGARRRAAVRS